MAVKVFLTGATGYIGGSAHAHVAKAHPEWEFTLFVRNEDRARAIKAAYPKTKFVYGTLTDSSVIEKAAAEADIVIDTADSADSVPAATAIAKGLAAGHTAEKPGYWIHLSGANILSWYDIQNERFGEAPLPESKYQDIDDIDKILTLPDSAGHRDVDKIVQGANSDAVRTAIICPPAIYDKGSGQVNVTSIQLPDLVRGTLEKGFAPIAGAGLTEWDSVNIEDLGNLYVKLADATQHSSKRDNPEVFGRRGYYFTDASAHKWSDVSRWVGEEASRQGYFPEVVTKTVTLKEVKQWDGIANTTWGRNSKGVGQRARKYLGWEPQSRSIKDTIPEVVAAEAKALGLTPKETKG